MQKQKEEHLAKRDLIGGFILELSKCKELLTGFDEKLWVALAYLLSGFETIGVFGIWISIPIGWILADITGCIYMKKCMK